MPQLARTPSVSPPERILITRLSAIGDCILTMPLLCAARRAFPEARIAWATQAGPAQLLSNHPCLDELIVIPKGWLHSPAKVWQVRRRMRQFGPDVVLDPQCLTKSALLGWLSGARRRVGFHPPLGREAGPYLNNVLVQASSEHVVDHHRELLKPLGVEPGPVEFRLALDPEAVSAMRAWIGSNRLTRYAVLNPGAGWDSRLWEPDRFAAVARSLRENRALRSVVTWAGERERGWAERIVAGSAGAAVAAPDTSLPQLAALLREAECFIGCDTGPLHLATAVGTRCVGMHGTTLPHQSGAYGPQHVHVQKHYQGGSSRERRTATNDAMRRITVEDVLQAYDALWRKAA